MGDISGNLVNIIKLGRLQFLFGGLLLYVLGAVVSIEMGYAADTVRIVLGYLVFAPAHLSVSYSNDLYDMEADSHNPGSAFTGGSGVLNEHPELKVFTFYLSLGLIAMSVLGSIFFAMYYGVSFLFVIMVAFGALLGWFYTAPPLRLSYRGLGEISTAATVGLMVPLYGFYAAAGEVPTGVLFFLFPMALSGIVFILIVQMPDREADIEGCKKTWVVKLGRRRSFSILFMSILLQTLYYGSMYTINLGPPDLEVLPFFLVSLIPLLVSIPGVVLRPTDREIATKIVTANMTALFAFIGILDIVYLLI